MSLLWLILPLSFALMRLATRRYAFSALVTLSCAGIVLIAGLENSASLVVLGLLLSVVGDWFMAHQERDGLNFLRGVFGFSLAHVAFIAFAVQRFAFSAAALCVALALAAGYMVYLKKRVWPGLDGFLRGALATYALISVAGLFCALCMDAPQPEKALYIAGIASILFSDTMIAEAEFAHHARAAWLILPTYYLCHMLIAASQLLR